MESKNIKIVMLGDHLVGKTSLHLRFENGIFNENYTPTIFNSYCSQLIVENISFRIQLWDTEGSNDYDQTRPLSYPQTDVFLLCFSVVSKESLLNIERKWIKEVNNYCFGTPCILVGLKSDLKLNTNQNVSNIELDDVDKNPIPIPATEIQEMKEKIKAKKYFECSSRDNININDIFEFACKLKLHNQKDDGKTKTKCNIF